MRVQLLPKSVVRYTHGVMSPNECRSNAAYAVPGSKRLASTQLVHTSRGRPLTFLTTLLQLLPPPRVSLRLPSSVPTPISLTPSAAALIGQMLGHPSAWP